MSAFPFSVNKIGLIGAIFFAFLLSAVALAFEPYVVGPVKKAADLRPLPAAAWPPPESDQSDLLLKLSYLRGLLDAMQYAEVAPAMAAKALKGLKGMNLHQIAAEIDRYYLADPRRRELPPASVVLRILPESRGKPRTSPLPR